MIYLDTSWLVKLYVEEPDAAVVRRVVAGDDAVFVSEIAYVEFHSAVARRLREAAISKRSAAEILGHFRREWSDRARVTVSHDVIVRAAAFVSTHSLRSLDALHLASGLLVASGAPEPLRFGAADARLVAAARREGLVTVEVE